MYTIPLFDLNYDEREEQAVIETLRSKWISTGPKTSRFETEFARMLHIEHALAVSNCTSSLHLAMKMLDIGPGDEVICPSLTFVATVNAIRYVDAVPVFADIVDATDLNIDPEDIARLVTEKTKAVVVMHYAGFPCNMDAIMTIAAEHDLKVIEDSCHGPLSEYNGKKLGTIGDIGCFSFFSNKNLSTGEGGMLVTNNAALYERAKLLHSHGMTTLSYERSKGHTMRYDVIELGYNYRMDDIRASLGIAQLEKLEGDLKGRAKIRARYEEVFADTDEIIVPFTGHEGFVSNYIFPVVLREGSRDRDEVRKVLQKQGIQTSMHYPPVHLFSIYREQTRQLPVTESVTSRQITLPMYASLSGDKVDYIGDVLKDSLNG